MAPVGSLAASVQRWDHPATSPPCSCCRGRGMASPPSPRPRASRGAELPPSESPQWAEEGAPVRGDPGDRHPTLASPWLWRWPDGRDPSGVSAQGWGNLGGTWRWALARGPARVGGAGPPGVESGVGTRGQTLGWAQGLGTVRGRGGAEVQEAHLRSQACGDGGHPPTLPPSEPASGQRRALPSLQPGRPLAAGLG